MATKKQTKPNNTIKKAGLIDISKLKNLVDKGYTLIPLNGKIPATLDWTRASILDFSPEKLSVRGANYGVVLGATDLVIDVDPIHFESGDKPLDRLVTAVDGLPKSFTVITGGGGLHIYLKKPAEVLISHTLKDYPGLEFKTKGCQMVGLGSIHPKTGNTYDILVDGKVAATPEKLLNLIKTTACPYAEIEKGELKNSVIKDLVSLSKLAVTKTIYHENEAERYRRLFSQITGRLHALVTEVHN